MNKNIALCSLLLLIVGSVLLSSCGSSKEVVYFQDMKPGETEISLPPVQAITVRPEDKISIIVNSRDPQLTDLFNLPYVSRQLGQSLRTNGLSTGTNNGISGYTVDAEGNIDFPVLGKVHVAGMMREEIAEHIKNELVTKNLVKDPVVTVEFPLRICNGRGQQSRTLRYRPRPGDHPRCAEHGRRSYHLRQPTESINIASRRRAATGLWHQPHFGRARVHLPCLLPATERCGLCRA